MLIITLRSFSYKSLPLRGAPSETTTHGGGFVFDCRCLLNPGRQAEFKEKTGKDDDVKRFLEDLPEVDQFLSSAHSLISLAVNAYIARGFDSLSVEFGCTGGQHRSVYCTEKTRHFLLSTWPSEKLSVKVSHLEMEARGIFSPES